VRCHSDLFNDGTQILNGDSAEKAGLLGLLNGLPWIDPDLPEESGLLRGAGRSLRHTIKEF